MTETDLVKQARGGDATAWESLIITHQDAVFRLAYLILGHAGDAEDVAQDTFIRAYRYLNTFDESRTLRPWLLSISANLARNRRRSLGRYIHQLSRMARLNPEAISDVEYDAQRRDESQNLWQAIKQLDAVDQQIIYLRFFLELSVEETAESLNIAAGTVKSRLHRALGRLRGVVASDFPALWRRGWLMNNVPDQTPPEPADENMEKWESAVRDTARHFVYPPTPDIATGVRARLKAQPRRSLAHGLRLAAAALLALAVVTLAVPQTRAFVIEALRVGVVRIFFGEPMPTPTTMPTPTAMGAGTISPTWTPRPAYTPIASPLDLPGETTLIDAERQLGSPILLPTYPAGIGAPDHIYAQEIGQGVVVTIIWLKGDGSRQVDLLLQILNRNAVAAKYFPWDVSNQQEVQINNSQQAFWLTDVHRLYFYETDGEVSRVVNKDVLLWDMRLLTYRLETDLPLEEAIRVAESLE